MNFPQDLLKPLNSVKNEFNVSLNKAKDILGIGSKISKPNNNEPNEITKLISKFYTDKSVLKTYNFVVNFKDMAYCKDIKPYHVKGFSIPYYPITVKTTNYGPVSKGYAVFEKNNPLILTINFEDDFNANVLKLATNLQATIMDSNGYYTKLNERYLGDIGIILYTDVGTNIFMWTCVNCYFLGFGGNVDMAYDSTDTLKIPIKFGCDAIKYTMHDYNRVINK